MGLAFPFFRFADSNSFGSQLDENLANQFLRCQKEFLTDRQVGKSAAKSACDLSNGRFHTLIPSTIPLQRSFCSSIGHISQYSIQGTNCLSKENENHFCFGSFILVMMLGCNDPESRDCRSPPSSHSICPKSKRQSGSVQHCIEKRASLPLTGTLSHFLF